jgi:hypothetical protein
MNPNRSERESYQQRPIFMVEILWKTCVFLRFYKREDRLDAVILFLSLGEPSGCSELDALAGA